MIIKNFQTFATFEAGIVIDNKIYFCEKDLNYFFCYDIFSKKLEELYSFEENEQICERMFSGILSYDRKLLIIPYNSDHVYIYDLVSKRMSILSDLEDIIVDYKIKYGNKAKFSSAHIVNDMLIIVGAAYPIIIKYDLIKKEKNVFNEWHEKILDNLYFEDSVYFKSSCIKDNKIYAPCCKSNFIIIIDIQNNDYNIKKVGDRNCSYSAICFDNNNFWLTERHGYRIWIWNEGKNELRLIETEKYSKENYSYGGIIFFKGKLYPLSQLSSQLLEIDKETKKIKIIYKVEGEKLWFSSHPCINKLIFSSSTLGKNYVVNNEDVISEFSIVLPQKYKKKYYSVYYHQEIPDNLFFEDNKDALEEFIKII